MATKTAEQMLTVKRVAARLDVSELTVYRRIWAGEIRWTDTAPRGAKRRSIRVSESALAEYQQRQERGGAR